MSRPMDEKPPALRPVGASERIETLDVMRGFSLFCIFLFNISVFSGWVFLSPEQTGGFATQPLDDAVVFLRHLLFENKGFALFSFMFGIGFGIMARRARRAGRSLAPHFLRRQGALLLIGAAHGALLWGGDILMLYAVLGLFLLPFLLRSDRTVLITATVLYLLPIPLYTLGLFVSVPAPYELAAGLTGQPNLYGIWMGGLTGGSLPAFVQGNLAFLAYWWAMFAVTWYWPQMLGMFLFGLFVGRSRLIDRVEREPGLLPGRLVVWAGVAGILGNLVFAVLTSRGVYHPPSRAGLLLTVVQCLAVPALCFFYLSALAWLHRRESWRPRLRPLAAVGRMALTHYLVQSLLCVLLFCGIGLGLFGKVGLSVAVAMAVGVFGLQVLFSRWWWSAGFAYGPAEWVWRQLTYGRRLPIRTRPEPRIDGEVRQAPAKP